MRNVARQLGVLVAVLGACAAVDCGRQPGTVVVAAVDLSASILPATVRFYADVLASNVCPNLGPQDRLIVIPIDSSAEAQTEVLYSLNLATQDFSKQPEDGYTHRHEREEARRQAYVRAQAQLISPAIEAAAARRSAQRTMTDVLGAQFAAADAFGPTTGRRVLLLLSDMVHETPDLTLRDLARSGESGVAPLLLRARHSRGVPRLDGVTVIVVGAGETAEPGRDPAVYYRAVRSFWQQWFASAGASLVDRNYGYRTQDRIAEVLRGMPE